MPRPETGPVRDPKREMKAFGLVWLGAAALSLGVVVFTTLAPDDPGARAAAIAAALDLDATAITPVGSPLRLPAGAHRAVVPAHVPAAAGAFPSDQDRGH